MFLRSPALSPSDPLGTPLKNSFLNSSTNPRGALSISWKDFTFLEAFNACLPYRVTFADALEVSPTILSPIRKFPLLVSST